MTREPQAGAGPRSSGSRQREAGSRAGSRHSEPEAEYDHVDRCLPGRHRDADAGEQVHGECHQGGAGDRKRLVASEAADQLPASDRRDEHAAHQRREQKPRLRGAVTLDDLQVEREIGDRAEEREADDEADRARNREGPVAEHSSGTTGSAARPSTNTNAPRSATPSTSSPTIWPEPHAHVVPPRLVKSTSADSPPA